MFNRLLPRHIDNTYHGDKLALWLFALLVLMKVAMSLNSILNGHSVAKSDLMRLAQTDPSDTSVSAN